MSDRRLLFLNISHCHLVRYQFFQKYMLHTAIVQAFFNPTMFDFDSGGFVRGRLCFKWAL